MVGYNRQVNLSKSADYLLGEGRDKKMMKMTMFGGSRRPSTLSFGQQMMINSMCGDMFVFRLLEFCTATHRLWVAFFRADANHSMPRGCIFE